MNRKWKRRLQRHVTPSTVGLLVAAVLVAVGSVALVTRDPEPPVDHAADRARAQAIAQHEAEERAEREAAQRRLAHSLATPGEPSILFLGDSWTEGFGARTSEQGYAYLTGERLGGDYYVQGIGGSGYTVDTKGQPQSSYLDRAAELPVEGFEPNLVVIQGGGNDYVSNDVATRAAVKKTVETVHERLPDAKVVVLPLMTPLTSERIFDVCQWGETAGAVCLDSSRWISDKLIDETSHPDTDGHALIARKLVAALRSRGVG